jgi:hypothetical protein
MYADGVPINRSIMLVRSKASDEFDMTGFFRNHKSFDRSKSFY